MAVSNKYELQCLSNPPTMALCGETAALFILKKYELWLKGDRCSNLPLDHHLFPWNSLYCLFSYCVWTELHGLSFTVFYPPSVIIPLQFGNKATWKSTSHPPVRLFHIFSQDNASGMREKEKKNDHFQEESYDNNKLFHKYESFNRVMFFQHTCWTKVQSKAISSHYEIALNGNTTSGNSP